MSRYVVNSRRPISTISFALILAWTVCAPLCVVAQDPATRPVHAPATKDDSVSQPPPARDSDPDWKIAWRKKWLAQQERKARAAVSDGDTGKPTHAAKRKAVSAESDDTPIVHRTHKSTSNPTANETRTVQVAGAKAPIVPAAKPVTPPPAPVADPILSETKPDGPPPTAASTRAGDRTVDSPLSAVRDGWKMLLYLIPTLLLIVAVLAGLRRVQGKMGRLPGPLHGAAIRQTGRKIAATGGGWAASLLAGLQRSRTSNRATGNIRLVETVPIGGANLHLVEVRGRILLLGASGSGIALLTELTDPKALETDEFRSLLHAAAVDLETLDADTSDLPAAALVGSLEDGLRDTSDALAYRTRRLRTVQEEEDAFNSRGNQERIR